MFDQWLVPWDADNFHWRRKNPWQIPYGTCVLLHSNAWLEMLLGLTSTYNISFITYTAYRRKECFKWKVLVVRIQLATDIIKGIISETLAFNVSWVFFILVQWCFCAKKEATKNKVYGKSTSRYHSVKCAHFSAPILAFLHWNHSRLVPHLPSLERLWLSEWPSRFLFHGLCCIIQWSVCLSHAKSLSVPHIATPIIRNCWRWYWQQRTWL